jgi:hypothetical protein
VEAAEEAVAAAPLTVGQLGEVACEMRRSRAPRTSKPRERRERRAEKPEGRAPRDLSKDIYIKGLSQGSRQPSHHRVSSSIRIRRRGIYSLLHMRKNVRMYPSPSYEEVLSQRGGEGGGDATSERSEVHGFRVHVHLNGSEPTTGPETIQVDMKVGGSRVQGFT